MSNAIIRDASVLIGRLGDGYTVRELSDAIHDVIVACQDAAGAKGKASGTVTLSLAFTIEGVRVDVTPTITSKKPKVKQSADLFFALHDGTLSLEHPKQHAFDFPRVLDAARTSDVAV